MIRQIQNTQWREIPGFDGLYIISEFGNIYNTKASRFLTIKKSGGNKITRYVHLCYNGNPQQLSVNKLIQNLF